MTDDEKKLQARQLLMAMLAIGAMKPDGEPEYSSELEWLYQNDPKNDGSGRSHDSTGNRTRN